MNTVTRFLQHYRISDGFSFRHFASAQAVQDFIARFVDGPVQWDVRHAEDCAARLRRGQCDCEIPPSEAEQLDIDRHEDARHDAFMEQALEPHDEPLG